MRKLILTLALVTVINTGFSVSAQNLTDGKVIAYYFHGSFRCRTCNMMEKYSRQVIENNFKNALDSEKLEFKAINVEESGNEHFVNDYQLYSKALILSLVKDGKEIQSKNLTKIWQFASNKQRFFDYVTEEISSLMKELQ
ncbi:MAG: nitrophenyl compound nitroreductase subunit ArsF family protein [Candidatus Theseobacter exili]|nr:nitrophenyl compound nitroreductase subunit ArsF family protein [Candidatus Theseobacter exili]